MPAKLAPAKTAQQVVPSGTETPLNLTALNAHIALELAAGLSTPSDIRERYGITDPQWDILKKNPAFKAMLLEALQKLRGDLNAGKRITLKAEVALEDSIEMLYSMIHSETTPAAARIDGVKTLATLAGRGKEAVGSGGSGFQINIQINSGDDEKTVSVQGALPAPEAA